MTTTRTALSTLSAGALALSLAAAWPAPASAQTRTIVIDPGHGGSDPGGTGNGLQEKNIVVDVGKRFKQLLDADTDDPGGGGSWVAILTRDDDTFVSLSARAALANSEDADRFMSIHSNAFSSASANGTETFSFAEGSTGASMRNLVQSEMIAAWGRTNRGNKTANFAVLRETAMPAELHELAFITNAADAAFLASATQRQKAAQAHLRAIQRHFGITPFIPSATGSGGGGEEEETGAVSGRVVGQDGPIAGAEVRLDDGEPVTTPEDGRFAFAQVPVGPHTLTVSARGYQDVSVDIDVGIGARGETEIELSPSGATGGGEGDDDTGPGAGPGDEGGPDGDGGPAASDGGGCASATHGARSGPLTGVLPLVLVLVLRLRRRRRG
ncbi:MAG TPA: N-acetylmuramoyl-L-alanine amidase [Kofleriaceae bacterium]|nr:N-acetylmuramoyl-L-alanine amidase [Kofleriaceae bacterium]